MISIDVIVADDGVESQAWLREAHAAAAGFGPEVAVHRVILPGAAPSIHVAGEVLSDTYAGVPAQWMIEAAVLRAVGTRGLLFLCVANSARSQLAEGIARHLAPPDVTVWSAGSAPTRVRPEAIVVLAEIGIDISPHRSKAVHDVPAEQVDTVITLCGEEECPVFLGRARRLHWGLDDPAAVMVSEDERLAAFRRTRDELGRRLGVVFPRRAHWNDRPDRASRP